MSAKHTPGGWSIEAGNAAGAKTIWARESEGGSLGGWPRVVANIPRPGEVYARSKPADEAEANARLIAAAPDLLEAHETNANSLEIALAHIKDPDVRAVVAECIACSRAAIAKAEGSK